MKYRRNVPYIGEEEVEAAAEVIRSGMVVRGKVAKEFEKRFAEIHNKKYCVITSSCTAALQLSLEIISRELDQKRRFIQTPKWALIPDYTFVATGNAALNVGMSYKVIDVFLNTYNMNLNGRRIIEGDVIVPMHCFGNPCDISDVLSEYKKNNYIVEDAATAIGSDGIGYGDIQCFSFHGAKIMTTGIGGCLTTNNKEWAELAEELARAGRTGDPETNWRQRAYNYQISDVLAAMGIEQLKKLPFILERRRALAKRYNELFETSEEYISVQETKGSNYQSYVIRIDESIRDKVMEYLRSQSIEACKGNYSLTSLYFQGEAPNGKLLDQQQLCLPLYVQMSDDDQDFIVERTIHAVRKFSNGIHSV